MNKGQLIDRIAENANLPKSVAEKALNGFIQAITEALESGEKVTLVGFGTFYVTERKARTGINPSTGKTINIPAKKVPKFKAGSKLQEAVL
ncbi:DNA-binding protein HU-beta [Dissulfuribacter thermophilus]|uniref:DNA-binding protein HU-beta n=1 Tax=Dissulfuribacter thermophilus TaxID=1156395 RepID=A0A1B9F5W2_9BACT|nr:HU family DNA-binding protein [Dissulfuribacter thermophilus]OCC15263.1 DNA-binding protein HU-beta [Dissulfuribacter thermophilus]